MVPADWKLTNVISIFKKVKKEDSKNYRPVSLRNLELKLAKDVKENKKDFFKYVKNKKKPNDISGLGLSGGDTLVIEDEEKAEQPNAFFTSVFSDKTTCIRAPGPEAQDKEYLKEDSPLVKVKWVREHLGKLDIHKSMGPDRN
ncbi:hypothetical protein BTVI_67739 [Pitangus sulphuratus]|nr:hypothetical protein BTVI_67739 [Pitangus sulphuratus]